MQKAVFHNNAESRLPTKKKELKLLSRRNISDVSDISDVSEIMAIPDSHYEWAVMRSFHLCKLGMCWVSPCNGHAASDV